MPGNRVDNFQFLMTTEYKTIFSEVCHAIFDHKG